MCASCNCFSVFSFSTSNNLIRDFEYCTADILGGKLSVEGSNLLYNIIIQCLSCSRLALSPGHSHVFNVKHGSGLGTRLALDYESSPYSLILKIACRGLFILILVILSCRALSLRFTHFCLCSIQALTHHSYISTYYYLAL
jgi:hypothetical protein